jgi:hypothetical protein
MIALSAVCGVLGLMAYGWTGLTRRTAIRPEARPPCGVLIGIRYSAEYDSGDLRARSLASNNGHAAFRSFRLMEFPNRVNGGNSPSRLRNAGLFHFHSTSRRNSSTDFFFSSSFSGIKASCHAPQRIPRLRFHHHSQALQLRSTHQILLTGSRFLIAIC